MCNYIQLTKCSHENFEGDRLCLTGQNTHKILLIGCIPMTSRYKITNGRNLIWVPAR